MRLALAMIVLVLVAQPALAATEAPAPFWKVEKLGPQTCVALGPDSAAGAISLGATGPVLRLLFSADSLPDATATHQVELAIDDAAPLYLTADGSDGVVGIPVTAELAAKLAGAHHLLLTIDGRPFVFDVRDVAVGIRDVDECAGAMMADHAPPPEHTIPGAGDWRLADSSQPNGCSARLEGPEVDTMLIVNKDDKLILAAGRADWDSPATGEDITLKVDDGTPTTVHADALQSLVLVLVSDEPLMASLRKAHRLTWTLPNGHFEAIVTGLGAAFDAARACMHPAPAPTT
jgi:hypothetical protein